MTEQCPRDVAVLQLCYRDLTSEGTVGFVEDILGCNLDVGRKVLTSEEKVQTGRCDDNFGIRVELGCGQVVDDLFDGLDRPIPTFVALSVESSTRKTKVGGVILQLRTF